MVVKDRSAGNRRRADDGRGGGANKERKFVYLAVKIFDAFGDSASRLVLRAK
jgi:hypothetical protein